jgi:hypothetical protein
MVIFAIKKIGSLSFLIHDSFQIDDNFLKTQVPARAQVRLYVDDQPVRVEAVVHSRAEEAPRFAGRLG